MSNRPSVSIIIPVRNEIAFIRICLDSILVQDYPEIKEIIVSDGLSTDGTEKILLEYKNLDQRINLLSNPKKIQTAALNDCIKQAKSEIVVRIDAHAYYPKEYVSLCVKYLLETHAGNVGGSCITAKKEGYIPNIINLISESPFGIGAAKFRQHNYEGFIDSVWPGVFWRRIFDEVGLFKEELVRTEDIEFNQRLRIKGYKIYKTPKIKAYYYARDTMRGFLLQNFMNGFGIMQTLISTKKIIALRHFIPFIFVLSIFLLIFFSFLSNFAKIILFLDLSLYSAANIYFSVRSALKKGLKYFFLLPFVFAGLHFSYGIGSAWAVMKQGGTSKRIEHMPNALTT